MKSLCKISIFLLLQLSASYLNINLHHHHRKSLSLIVLQAEAIRLGLTRELGTNDKLSNLLSGTPNLDCFEIPCIQFFEGEDVEKLKTAMVETDIIIISSPQSADVFLSAWTAIGKPKMSIAVVGKGTAQPLIAAGITPIFTPSDATAVSLSAELPLTWGTKILYPTSAIAENTMQSGLESRGFQVTRLNTYTTGPAVWTDDMLLQAKTMHIVTFASPSAVRTWAERVGTNQIAVTIGPTSQKVAVNVGFSKVFSPQEGSKGIEPWAELIKQVALNKPS